MTKTLIVGRPTDDQTADMARDNQFLHISGSTNRCYVCHARHVPVAKKQSAFFCISLLLLK